MCKGWLKIIRKVIFEDFGICIEKFKYLKYVILINRLIFFNLWLKLGIVSGKKLFKVGFFYDGMFIFNNYFFSWNFLIKVFYVVFLE